MPQMTQQELLEIQALRNAGGVVETQHQLGTFQTKQKKQVEIAVYDFSVLGGAVGSVNLKNLEGKDCKLPKGAVITSAYIDVVTSLTSGGSATVAIGAASTNDLKAATAYGSITAITACVPVGTAASAVKLSSDATVTATIATAALTAGKFYVLIEYIFSSTT